MIEEYLDGPEVSLFVITDGVSAVPLLPAQDFKRVGRRRRGAEHGWHGRLRPAAVGPARPGRRGDGDGCPAHAAEMTRRGMPFSGLLYIGLALTSRGTRVVEFNVRFGDPETEAVLALLETPLAGLLHAAAVGRLATHEPLRWRPGSAVAVVIAAPGYPGTPETGAPIEGSRPGPIVLHCGTTWDPQGRVVSAGGRVLCAVGTGADLGRARDQRVRSGRRHHAGRRSPPPGHRPRRGRGPGARYRAEPQPLGSSCAITAISSGGSSRSSPASSARVSQA